MSRTETQELIEVMQAFVDGAEIEWIITTFPGKWTHADTPIWNWAAYRYRIKHALTYRPWTREECPVGEVVVSLYDKVERQIIARDNTQCCVAEIGWVLYENVLEQHTMADGSPCGVEEVEPL